MKTKIVLKKIRGRTPVTDRPSSRMIWQWRVMEGRKIVYGGLCATKRDAMNDARSMLTENNDSTSRGTVNEREPK